MASLTMRARPWWLLALASFATAWLAHEPVERRWRAVELLSALGRGAELAPERSESVNERDVQIDAGGAPIRARLYSRDSSSKGPGIVIAHGIHYRGIDERRLVPFAREIARTGRVVLTPELSELTDYRISAQGVDVIARSVSWLSSQRELVTSSQVGVLGFSFAGGLALVAAGRPELRDRVEFVSSVGGHHDLARVLDFLVTNRIQTPNGTRPMKAHDYGLAVVVYQHVDRFVDQADRAALEEAFRHWLREDRPRALASASLRTTASGERLFSLLESQRLNELGPELRRLLAERERELRDLSPRGRLRSLRVPVYLLHGSADSVIPPSETDWAAAELQGSPHRALVSPLIEHVEVRRTARLSDELALVNFMAQLL